MEKSLTNDERILNAKKEIAEKKALLANVMAFRPTTNANFTLFGTRYNLHVVNKEQLVFLAGVLNNLQKSANEIFPGEVLKIDSYSTDQWLADIKARYQVLERTNEEAKLKQLEDNLHKLLTNDTKVTLELDNLLSQI